MWRNRIIVSHNPKKWRKTYIESPFLLACICHIWYNIDVMKKTNETKKINLSDMSRSELEQGYVDLNDRNMALEAENAWLREQVKLSKRQKFGSSSEQGLADGVQLSLFDEVELAQDPEAEEPASEDVIKKTQQAKKKKRTKKDKIRNLPIERVDYKLSEEEQVCPKCGSSLHEMKKIVHDEITVVPTQYKVHRKVQYVYACRNCEKTGTEATIIKAPAPNHFFLNSLASSSLLADIICKKYVLSLPLYRQEQEFARYGLDLKRTTISNWIIRAADLYLYRIEDAIRKKLLCGDIVLADETEIQVLHEKDRSAQAKSFMWVYTNGRSDTPCFIYRYAPGRGQEYPKEFLKEFSGFLQTDGYSAYDAVVRDAKNPIMHVGCIAHARRKFTDALKASSVKDPPNILKGIAFCDRLFDVERECSEMSPHERTEYRKEHAAPVLDAYFEWLRSIENEVLPKSKLGIAVKYSLDQEQKLRRYMDDGRLEISTNRVERAVRPFVIGRGNWLFANTPDGANASAMIYSIVETAKANNLKPFEYFEHVLTVLSQNPEADIKELVPWSEHLPEKCRMKEHQGDADLTDER